MACDSLCVVPLSANASSALLAASESANSISSATSTTTTSNHDSKNAIEGIRKFLSAVKEAQVSLFVEQRKCHEQQLFFKEHRAKTKTAAAAARATLSNTQCMLLRAHHDSLRAAGQGSAAFQLSTLLPEAQVAAAMRWADTAGVGLIRS